MVIMIEHRRRLAGLIAGLTGAIVMVRAISINADIRVVLMLVMPKMMRLALHTFMQAVRFHGSPDGLERQQHQQENGDQSTHGFQCIGRKRRAGIHVCGHRFDPQRSSGMVCPRIARTIHESCRITTTHESSRCKWCCGESLFQLKR